VVEVEHRKRFAAAKRAGMFGDDPPVLADHDAVRIGMDLDRPADRAGGHRIFVVVEVHQSGLRHRCRHRVEAVEPARICDGAVDRTRKRDQARRCENLVE
jgi:hypothetical protein